MLILIWVILAASSKCPLGCVHKQPSWWCNYISTPAFLGRVLKCLTSWQYSIRMSFLMRCFFCFQLRVTPILWPLRATSLMITGLLSEYYCALCVWVCVCACGRTHECLVTMFVSSGPNWPMMTSGSCWWRHGRRRPPLHPLSPDTMSESHAQLLSKCCGNNGGRSDMVNVFS